MLICVATVSKMFHRKLWVGGPVSVEGSGNLIS